jgi:hypothetical protein
MRGIITRIVARARLILELEIGAGAYLTQSAEFECLAIVQQDIRVAHSASGCILPTRRKELCHGAVDDQDIRILAIGGERGLVCPSNIQTQWPRYDRPASIPKNGTAWFTWARPGTAL